MNGVFGLPLHQPFRTKDSSNKITITSSTRYYPSPGCTYFEVHLYAGAGGDAANGVGTYLGGCGSYGFKRIARAFKPYYQITIGAKGSDVFNSTAGTGGSSTFDDIITTNGGGGATASFDGGTVYDGTTGADASAGTGGDFNLPGYSPPIFAVNSTFGYRQQAGGCIIIEYFN